MEIGHLFYEEKCMGKKFSIVEKLNEDKLMEQIELYIKINVDYPCIYMNRETFSHMNSNALSDMEEDEGGIHGLYRGYDIYENNDLKFGEVELR